MHMWLAVEIQGSQDRPFTGSQVLTSSREEQTCLSLLMVHIMREPTPSLPHSGEGQMAVMDGVQNAAAWYRAEGKR